MVRSPQEEECRTSVDQDEGRSGMALQVQKSACQHVVGAGSPVGGPAEIVLVTMCEVSLLHLRAK